MTTITAEISMSLDGFVAGPNPTLEEPLGVGGERLHEWVVALAAWRAAHGLTGGETNASTPLVEESHASSGAFVMGRRMFSGGQGDWADDPRPEGWWGEEPPFHAPVFVLTHHPREPLVLGETTFTFVTDGIEAALDGAEAAAGERNVLVSGGASAIQQALASGRLDWVDVNLTPVLLGGGTRLFEGASPDTRLELERVVASDGVTHLRYRILG